jgi:plasmid stabilization system protein ParE
MAKLKIYWTRTAVAQRDHTFEYWNNRNKSNSYSIKLNALIKERISLLIINPEMGKITEFTDTRAVSLRHYSILYKRTESEIFITGFWDNRQNPKKLLNFLTGKGKKKA